MLLILARFVSVWAGTPFPIDLVTSDSMSPTLMEGDVVAWTPTKISDIEVGDVIVFKSKVHWPDEKILVHRVSDIKTNSRGEILLETKGDKNEWVDQAGPHIPEPYIKKDNLMGKVLSIGKQPLKIPFIGYLGLWINQGLNSISQPSQSKDSTGYVGIFAPLTISIVILVVLIFILPEKAKTIKEKIHLNIFGRKPLKLKKTFFLFIIVYMLFLSVIHLFAYDSMEASIGIEATSPDVGMDFGRIGVGGESNPKTIPLINPSTMPVKGFVFVKGDMGDFIEPLYFQLESGEEQTKTIKAVAPNGTAGGAYRGDITLYSSPFWLMFPDDLIQNLVRWNPEAAVYILDALSGFILTTLTLSILITITFIGDILSVWLIERSWHHSSRLLFKKETVIKLRTKKKNFRRAISRGMGWILKIDFSKISFNEKPASFVKKPIVAAFIVTIPMLYFLEDKILAMFICVFVAGILAYSITCKVRSKIVLTTLIVMTIAIIDMMIQTNLIVLSEEHTNLEIAALTLGAFGIYLLILAILMMPLALLVWGITRNIRNLKERQDPLLSLEGSCDL